MKSSESRPAATDPTSGSPAGGEARVDAAGGESPRGTALADKAVAYPPGFRDRATEPGPSVVGPPPSGNGAGAAAAGGRRPYLQQVIHDALGPKTAKFGATWIVILMFFASFAPFIANSHPVVYKPFEGGYSSPLLASLGPADVVLPVAFISAAVLILLRRHVGRRGADESEEGLSLGQGVALVLWLSTLTFVFAFWPSADDYWTSLRGQRGEVLSFTAAAAVMGLIGLLVLALLVLPPLLALPRRAALVGAAVLSPLLVLLLVFPVDPPARFVYEQYREAEAAGEADVVVNTVIPYSASDRFRDRPGNRLQAPNATHWLGTDNYGADQASRMIHAARIALAIGFIATGIAVVIGVVIGALMGYFAGVFDLLGMRLIEILEAVPRLVLLIAVAAVWGRNLYLMMAIIGLLSWTGDARFIRAEFLKLRKQDFVQAAIAAGLPLRSILFRHMLPNGISPVLVSASFGVASAILLESTLSFLGLGLVDEPSWGAMLNQVRSGGAGFNWWIATFPGLAMFLTVFSYNLVGESIRDALDPKLLKRDA